LGDGCGGTSSVAGPKAGEAEEQAGRKADTAASSKGRRRRGSLVRGDERKDDAVTLCNREEGMVKNRRGIREGNGVLGRREWGKV